jgi:hypothetical protein
MNTSLPRVDRQLVAEKGIIPKLRLGTKGDKGVVGNGPKRVKLVAVKFIDGVDPRTGKPMEYVRYLFEENGEKKVYQTKKLSDAGEVSYLVQRLAEINDGEEVILEMKKRGIKNYVNVTPVSSSNEVEVDEDGEEFEGEIIE